MRQSNKHLNIESLTTFSDALKEQNTNKEFKMLFVTAAGIILAEIEKPLDGHPTLDDYIEDMTDTKFNTNVINYLKHEKIQKLKSTDEVAGDTFNFVGDGSLILLKNVKFYHKLDEAPYLILEAFALHSDDVIGFSLVPKEKD